MQEFFIAYYERLQALHRGISESFDKLPSEALDYTPSQSMNSLAVLVVHTAGAERYWIGDVAGQVPSGRIRSEEFKTQGLSSARLQGLLDETLAHSYSVLQRLNLDDLEKPRYSSRDNKTYTVAWALNHALEHTGIHLGHLQIGRELWLLQAVDSG